MTASERVTTVLNLMAELEIAYQTAEQDMTRAAVAHEHDDFTYYSGKLWGIRECINTLHFSILKSKAA